MNTQFNAIIVEENGIRSISGGGTNATTASGALFNLGGVSLTESQTISGAKEFAQRPTVNGTGVLLEGEIQSNTIISGVVYSAQVNVKNGEGNTIYKGQPVYIKGADGSNIIVGLASNTGESTSSKTLGLVVQDSLAQNAFGTVITDGLLEGFNASAANAGDPVWLGPTGSLIYGLVNKPYAPNHLVYLGVVTRAQNNGELFVKVQNGYELEELHNVSVTGAISGQFLYKQNGQWSAKNIDILDVSGLQSSLDNKLSLSGGTITGKLNLSTGDGAAILNFKTGQNPSSPNVGDFWLNAERFRYRGETGNITLATTTLSNSFIQPQVIATNTTSSPALRINQTGTAPALLVEDDAYPDSTAFTIDASGRVGIGVSPDAAGAALSVDAGGIKFGDGSVQTTTANRIQPNSQSAPYTLQLADAGKYIDISAGGVTVPSAIFTSGDVISVYNNSANAQVITQGAGVTMYLAGTSTTGSRTLAQRGVATILCVGSNTFTIIGGGLT